jgi:DNA-binding XRE family transcriptional regulator
MDKTEFSRIRNRLGKSQRELAQLLGTSVKAVESFEQGWRRITVHVERQMLFLLSLKSGPHQFPACWEVQDCPEHLRNQCPAWEFKAGHLCWFINGTICRGEVQKDWASKMKICRQCSVLKSLLDV